MFIFFKQNIAALYDVASDQIIKFTKDRTELLFSLFTIVFRYIWSICATCFASVCFTIEIQLFVLLLLSRINERRKKSFFLKKVSTYKYPITQRFHYFFFLLSFFAFLFQLLFFCVIIAIRSFCFHGALGVNFDQFRQRRMERSKQKRPEEKNKSKKNKIYFLLI